MTKKEAKKALRKMILAGEVTQTEAQARFNKVEALIDAEKKRRGIVKRQRKLEKQNKKAVKAKLKAIDTAKSNPTEANLAKAAQPTYAFLAKSRPTKPVAVNGPTDPLLHAIAEKADPSDYRTMRIDDDPVTREIASERVQKSAGADSKYIAPIRRTDQAVSSLFRQSLNSDDPHEREQALNAIDDVRDNGFDPGTFNTPLHGWASHSNTSF